jgi:solute carrier family 30 (zinc transporter), member 1
LRAEILGAFFNAVFLIALCLSIVLEAITRLIDPPEIGNPQLILIVGCLGLVSNFAGFIVLGGHGHSHGAEEHDHEHGDKIRDAEEGDNHDDLNNRAYYFANKAQPAANIVPITRATQSTPEASRHIRFTRSDETASTSRGSEGSLSRSATRSSRRQRRRASSNRANRLSNIDDISIHPASFRQEIIAASRPILDDTRSEEDDESDEDAVEDEAVAPVETSPLLSKSSTGPTAIVPHSDSDHRSNRPRHDSWHAEHNHNKPKKAGKSSNHDHGDMGMNAMILHVMGDALGNIGVIVSALIIWLTSWPGRFYADPAVSLFITIIILRSTIPLTSATAKILLQATPDHLDVNNIKEDIQGIPCVASCHHVHIWQLSDSQIIASLHIRVSFPISEAGADERYMEISRAVRKCLHAYGIHSATIQPEFCVDRAHDHGHDQDAGLRYDGLTPGNANASCLLECVDNCNGMRCCSGPKGDMLQQNSEHDGHAH